MFEAHTFLANRPASPQELHCLVAHQSDHRDVPVKVEVNGRLVRVILSAGMAAKSVSLGTNAFEWRRTEAVAPWTAGVGDVATVSMDLCYEVHRRAPRGERTTWERPFDAYGRIKPNLLQHVLDYLQRRTGLALYELVDGDVVLLCELHVIPHQAPDKATMGHHKVWCTSTASLSLHARVVNPDVFNLLSGQAIGKRRSFGFGSVRLDMLEPAVRVDDNADAGSALEALVP